MASTHSEPGLLTGDRFTVEIDGFSPTRTITPSTAADVAEALATAASEGHAVAPVGFATKLALGNTPDRLDVVLSTRALDRVLHYEPDDLTLSVEAGIRFSDVQELLAGRGQTLPVESPDSEQVTIGGLIATALAGPRRFGNGTLRDLLIGISVAYPNGTVGKAGGLVVKNVTGFDLMRLHLGALGTLGVVVSANFKVPPSARHEATLVSEPESFDRAMEMAQLAREGRLRPIAVEVFGRSDRWQVAARYEGRPQTVSIGTSALQAEGGRPQLLKAGESAGWWRGYLDGQRLRRSDGHVIVRCGFEPKRTAEAVAKIGAALASNDISHENWTISPGLGSVTFEFDPDLSSMTSLGPMQRSLSGTCNSVCVLTAPVALKRDIDVWGRAPETVSVMRALKAEFDPQRILNPGRFVDRI